MSIFFSLPFILIAVVSAEHSGLTNSFLSWMHKYASINKEYNSWLCFALLLHGDGGFQLYTETLLGDDYYQLDAFRKVLKEKHISLSYLTDDKLFMVMTRMRILIIFFLVIMRQG